MNCIGTYDGTIFYNPANKFCIVSVKTADQSVPAEARSNRRYKDHLIRFTAVGYEIPRTDAVELELDGEWAKGKYGVQLQVEQWREIVPRTKNGVEGYLASGLIKGIGPKTAADIVERFGVDTLDILEHQPERLLEIRGITENKLEDIKASYAENRMLQGIMTLLAPFKITPKTALKIYQYFGPTSVEILEKSPFELCQISGFGFRRVDAIVQKSGGNLHDPMRIKGAVFCALDEGNLSFIEDLELMAGNRILVSKRNMIIPHVEENLDRGGFSMVDTIPRVCPCCGQPTRIHESSGKGENGEDRIIKTLYCDNPDCETRRLKKFVHFVSQKAMDIEGLSEAALEKFIGQGFIHSYLDIYRLDRYRAEIVRMDGFGEKSWQRLWDAIQQSRNTTFERYLISMDIPMIGNTASKVLGRVFHYDLDEFRDAVYGGYDFRQLPDFGETLHNNIHDWFCVEDNFCIWEELQTMMNIQKPAVVEHSEDREQDNPFVGKTIVVTGKVEPYTRDGINDLIESLGAHAGSSVSKKTDYLVCGENAGSKLSKARDLGVTVLSPAEFFSMAGAE